MSAKRNDKHRRGSRASICKCASEKSCVVSLCYLRLTVDDLIMFSLGLFCVCLQFGSQLRGDEITSMAYSATGSVQNFKRQVQFANVFICVIENFIKRIELVN